MTEEATVNTGRKGRRVVEMSPPGGVAGVRIPRRALAAPLGREPRAREEEPMAMRSLTRKRRIKVMWDAYTCVEGSERFEVSPVPAWGRAFLLGGTPVSVMVGVRLFGRERAGAPAYIIIEAHDCEDQDEASRATARLRAAVLRASSQARLAGRGQADARFWWAFWVPPQDVRWAYERVLSAGHALEAKAAPWEA